MKNSCVDRQKLFALSQQMLSASERERVRAHVEACESCRAVLRSYQSLDSVLNEWMPPADPSPWFDARVRAAANERENQAGWLGLNWARWMAAPALASLLLVAGFVVLVNGPLAHRTRPENVTAVSVQTVEKPSAQTPAASQELKMYQNLPVLEDFDMLSNFDVISELPKGSQKIAD